MRPVKLIISILVTQYKEIATSVYISVVVLLVKHQTAVCVKNTKQNKTWEQRCWLSSVLPLEARLNHWPPAFAGQRSNPLSVHTPDTGLHNEPLFLGGGCSLTCGRVHGGQWRQRPWLADEAEWEAVAAGKNLWHVLSAGTCPGHYWQCEGWVYPVWKRRKLV